MLKITSLGENLDQDYDGMPHLARMAVIKQHETKQNKQNEAKQNKIPGVGNNTERLESCALLMGTQHLAMALEQIMCIPQKLHISLPCDTAFPLLGIYP